MTPRRALVPLACGLCWAGAATAAPISISLTLPMLAQITGLTDVSFSGVDPGSDAVRTQSDCVWTNSLTRAYTVKATGSGSGSAFTLSDGNSHIVAYSVAWSGQPGATSGTALAANATSTSFTSLALTPMCTVAPPTSSTLLVTIAAADLQSMIGGAGYTGTLTLVITPQ